MNLCLKQKLTMIIDTIEKNVPENIRNTFGIVLRIPF